MSDTARNEPRTPRQAKVGTPRSTPSRRRTPRSSARRVPTTPHALHAIAATTPSRIKRSRREVSIYTPRKDLRFLSRLLVKERQEDRNRPEAPKPEVVDIPIEHNRNASLAPSLPSDYMPTDIPMPEGIVQDMFQDEMVQDGGISESDGANDGMDGFEEPPSPIDTQEYDLSLLKPEEPKRIPPKRTNDQPPKQPKQRPFFPLKAMSQIVKHFSPGLKTSSLMLNQLQAISSEFLDQQMQDLTSYARHSNRKTICKKDALLLIKRVNNVDCPTGRISKRDLTTLIFAMGTKFLGLEEVSKLEKDLFPVENLTEKQLTQEQVEEAYSEEDFSESSD